MYALAPSEILSAAYGGVQVPVIYWGFLQRALQPSHSKS